jgi:hypothetical protein
VGKYDLELAVMLTNRENGKRFVISGPVPSLKRNILDGMRDNGDLSET